MSAFPSRARRRTWAIIRFTCCAAGCSGSMRSPRAPTTPTLDIRLTAAERRAGREEIARLRGAGSTDPVVAVAAHATGAKRFGSTGGAA